MNMYETDIIFNSTIIFEKNFSMKDFFVFLTITNYKSNLIIFKKAISFDYNSQSSELSGK